MAARSQETATAIAARVNAGGSAREAVERSLRLAETDDTNAVIRVHRETALRAADAVDARVRAGERLPLAGVPVAIKDNILVQGHPAEACSKVLAGFVAPYTATAAARLIAAGAVPVATCNMDEFAFGSSNESSCRGPVRNPHDPTRIPGGSSGGSAAAVAAGIVPIALGSDTGGSIRQPASHCGVVGVKPGYGRISRYGLIAYGSSLDQIGPLATTVEDAALALRAMAGVDQLDATSDPRPVGELSTAGGLRGLRLGVVPAHREGLQPEVRAALDAAIAQAKDAGATIVEVAIPRESAAIACYYVIATGEAASNLARFDGVRYGARVAAPTLGGVYAQTRAAGFGAEAKRRIMLGTFVLASGYYDAYYKKAQQVRALLCQDFAAAFAGCDAILGPVAPTTAFRHGEKSNDPLQMYLSDIFTLSANLAGLPATAIPAGKDAAGLPIGLQVQGPMGGDAAVLRIAAGLEATLR